MRSACHEYIPIQLNIYDIVLCDWVVISRDKKLITVVRTLLGFGQIVTYIITLTLCDDEDQM